MVAGPWLGPVDALTGLRAVDVDDHVDTGRVEDGGAIVVVKGGVDVVHTDGVGTKLLEHDGIAQTDFLVRQGVTTLLRLVACLAAGLVVNTDDHEALLGNGVEQVLALDLDRVDGDGNARQEAGDHGEGAENLCTVRRLPVAMLHPVSLCVCELATGAVHNLPNAL